MRRPSTLALVLLLLALPATGVESLAQGRFTVGDQAMDVVSCFAVWHPRAGELQLFLFPFPLTEEHRSTLRAHPSPYEVADAQEKSPFAKLSLLFTDSSFPGPESLDECILHLARLGPGRTTTMSPAALGIADLSVDRRSVKLRVEGSRAVSGDPVTWSLQVEAPLYIPDE